MTAVPAGAVPSTISQQQAQLRVLLNRGRLFSILWLMGIGSAIAVYCAFKARRIEKASDGQLRGGFTMWWCFIVGAFGILVWAPIILVGIANQF
jgi:hypothetical protein